MGRRIELLREEQLPPGVTRSPEEVRMPAAMVSLRRVHPAVEIEPVEQQREKSLRELRRGQLELAVITRGGLVSPIDGDFIERVPLLSERAT
jgi:hypothetical protein